MDDLSREYNAIAAERRRLRSVADDLAVLASALSKTGQDRLAGEMMDHASSIVESLEAMRLAETRILRSQVDESQRQRQISETLVTLLEATCRPAVDQ